MVKKLFQRRFPTYFGGFLFGLAAVVILLQVKKAVAPNFSHHPDQRSLIVLAKGGSLRLRLGEEPGKFLAWGFPTQLMVGKKGVDGQVRGILRMEYRDLVERETLVGPLAEAGEYSLIAQFYACAFPGEKYCARVELNQPIQAVEDRAAPAELPLVVDVKGAAEKAAREGEASSRAP